MKIPESTSLDLIVEKWGIDAVKCFDENEVYLVLGHSTAKFPYWEAYSLNQENTELILYEKSCATKED